MGKKRFNISTFEEISLVIILLALYVTFTILYPPIVNRLNTLNILISVSLLGVLAMGMAPLIISGGIDLSVGSAMGFCGVLAALLLEMGMPTILAIILSLAAGLLIGFLNGFMIEVLKVNAIMTTIAMLNILKGLQLIISGGRTHMINDSAFNLLGCGRFCSIPVPIIIFLLLTLIWLVIFWKFQIGRKIIAVGSNGKAANLCGFEVKKIRISMYMICSACAALAGMIMAAQFKQGFPHIGVGKEFATITAVVLGGVSLAGGTGKIHGVLLGILILGVMGYGLEIVGAHSFYQKIAHGAILLVVIIGDQYKIALKERLLVSSIAKANS